MSSLKTATGTPTRRIALLLIGAFVCTASAQAHDFSVGDLVIDHPYAPPTPAGARTGAVYFRSIRNEGREADRLLGGRTPVANSIEIHRSKMDGNVMQMRAVPALDLPAGATLRLRHGGDTHVMLLDLKTPLKEGERFPITLRFEHAGEREVMVWVQQPKAAATEHSH
jgi:periplasmic copper chaperone A